MEGKELDPVTFEILSHRLEQIVAEAYFSLTRVSGNQIVYECGDHQEAVMNADGDIVYFGGGVTHWTPCLGIAVKHLVREYEENPGIFDGDQFLQNDPYTASVHAMDIQLLAPVFWEGKRVAWVGAASHQSDVGAIDPSGFCVRAEEVFHEGLQFPGIKAVERGVARKDIWESIRRMVRIPDLQMLDISAKIAANNVSKARLLEMIKRYGIDTVLDVFDRVMNYAEEMVRKKLMEIPDGSWKSVSYYEGHPEPYIRVEATVIKEKDSLTIDLTGSSPQSPGSKNSSMVATIAHALGSFLLLLCPDIPWSGGIFRPVKFVLPEGSIVNVKNPAPVSMSCPSGGGQLTAVALYSAISKMLLSSDKHRMKTWANMSSSAGAPTLSGLNKDGSFFIDLIIEDFASGMGAYPDRDGVNTGGNLWTPKAMIANVETIESLMPIMFLYRKENIDTGSPGKFRGGVGLASCMIPWDTPSEQLVDTRQGCGVEVRPTAGLSGGYPSSTRRLGYIRNSDVLERFKRGEMVRDVSEIKGEWEGVPATGISTVGKKDVICDSKNGGGGYGDPIDRDPALVLKDVKEGYVSLEAANDVYGVAIEPERLGLDLRKTEERRKEIIQERLKVGRQ
ncbi:MAG: hydantoinase B/oxoprolinase family protein [Deltaproteobacteria bacterium]|nr:MAG: hydantoinase B/oxoprolinase family protein [Deltaproteobacteria bacterium]